MCFPLIEGEVFVFSVYRRKSVCVYRKWKEKCLCFSLMEGKVFVLLSAPLNGNCVPFAINKENQLCWNSEWPHKNKMLFSGR